MVVMVILGVVIALVVVRAQLEQMRDGRKQKQDELEQQLLRRPDANNQRQHPEQFYFYQFYYQNDRKKRQHQLVFDQLFCKNKNLIIRNVSDGVSRIRIVQYKHVRVRNLLIFLKIKNLLIFLKKRPVERASTSTSSLFGSISSLTRTPLPSNERGVMRYVAPSNSISGIFTSRLWDIMKWRHLPYIASVTSSIGDSVQEREREERYDARTPRSA